MALMISVQRLSDGSYEAQAEGLMPGVGPTPHEALVSLDLSEAAFGWACFSQVFDDVEDDHYCSESEPSGFGTS